MRITKLCLTGTLLVLFWNYAQAMERGTEQTNTDKPIISHSLPTDQLIIKFRDAQENQSLLENDRTDRISAVGNQLGLRMEYMRLMSGGAEIVKLEKPIDLSDAYVLAGQIAQNPNVLYAEPDARMQIQFTPNDSRYNEQWHYFEPAGGINLPLAWDRSTGSGVVVAVVDTGILTHADLNGQILPGYDFIGDINTSNDGDARDSDPTDPGDWVNANQCGQGAPSAPSSWHGTHVAGTIAASTDNSLGVSGVAFNAKILPVRVLGKCGGFLSDITDGIMWAAGLPVSGIPNNANPANIINVSLGGRGSCGTTYTNAINAARNAGVTIIVAAGNSNTNVINTRPANCPGVITVSATKRDGGRAFYSNFGSIVDIAAPGGELFIAPDGVLSALNRGSTVAVSDSYEFYQGTSMATPHVVGVAALLYAANPSITPDEVEQTIVNTARAFPNVISRPCDTNICGGGIIDAQAAVDSVIGAPNLAWLPAVLALILY